MISYHLLMCTDYYTNMEVRYSFIGMSMIVCTGAIIALNMSTMIYYFVLKIVSMYKYEKNKKQWLAQEKYMTEVHQVGVDKSIIDQKKTIRSRIRGDLAELVLLKKRNYFLDLVKMKQMNLEMTDVQKAHLDAMAERGAEKTYRRILKINRSKFEDRVEQYKEEEYNLDSLRSEDIEENLELEAEGLPVHPEFAIFMEAIDNEPWSRSQFYQVQRGRVQNKIKSIPVTETSFGLKETFALRVMKSLER